MKNLLSDKPDSQLNARMRESIRMVKAGGVKGKHMLDVGCGYGWFELAMLKAGVARITGIEITDEDLRTARENIHDKRAAFAEGGALDIPCADAAFDTVVAWEVIEHIPKHTEPTMFSEVARVLKPGGRFYLSTPYGSWPSRMLDPAWWLIGHRHYTRKQLQDYGEQAGFNVVSIYTKGGMWSLLSILNMYVSKWIFRRQPIFGNFFAAREAQEYKREGGIAGVFAVYEKR